MKVRRYIVPLLFVLSSCSNFLDYKDKDKVIPSTLDEYSELVFGELIAKSADNTCFNILMMSDDMGCVVRGSERDAREEYLNWYNWAKEPQIKPNGDEMIDPAWEFLYNKILTSNMIEENVNAFEEDVEGVKYRLLGEVQAVRAMAYWYLVNMYGEPWRSDEQAQTAMGVPVNQETTIKDHFYSRANLATIYELIETDLLHALDNLAKGEQKNTIFRPNADVVRLFLSRIYLEQKRYDDVITVCNDLLKETSKAVMNYERLKKNSDDWVWEYPILSRDGGNLLFTWWERNALPGFTVSGYSIGRYCVAPDLMALAKQNPNDIRGQSYTFWNYDGTEVHKFDANYSSCFGMNYRIEEVYFNRAEAYLNTNQKDLALADLMKVYKERIAPTGNATLEAQGIEEATDILRREKRIEFCFEDIRWFDIRRWGVALEHAYPDLHDSQSIRTFVLEAESPNYVLPLPLDVQRINPDIKRQERVETIVK